MRCINKGILDRKLYIDIFNVFRDVTYELEKLLVNRRIL